MNKFFAELKRRNVFKVGLAYLVVAWAVLQFVDIVEDPMALPDWFQRVTIVALAIGFPLALLLSWAYEVTPDGVVKTEDVDKYKSITSTTGNKINKLILGALGLAVAFLLYDKFMLSPDQPVVSEAVAGQTSIAVLPFVNMSSDPEQEFFSDGITEEILNVLAKNRSLKVAGRTSSFAYKGENQDLRAIGKALGVDYLVEGSIRKSGNTVRITAQVIQAGDGFHIWSETYDRELTDIFAVQDEIARAVADALEVSFGLDQGESLVTNTTDNMAAYDLFLKAREAHKRRRIPEAIELAKQVIDQEPGFAPAWAVYAQAWALAPDYLYNLEPVESAAALGRAYISAQKALILDPKNVTALGALANVQRARRDWIQAEATYLRALDIDPDSPVILEDYSEFLFAVGKINASIVIAEKLYLLEPEVPIYKNPLKFGYLATENYAEARDMITKMLEKDPGLPILNMFHMEVFWRDNNLDEAKAFLATKPELPRGYLAGWELFFKGLELGLEGLTPEELELAKQDWTLLAVLGRGDILFPTLSEAVKLGFWGDYFTPMPEMKKFRGTPEFNKYLVELGLPEYWRENGWADFCGPVGNNDFECSE